MNAKTIILTVIATVVILAGVLAIAFFTMPPVAYAVSTLLGGTPNPGYGPGYGRGMMGGGGMMSGGYYNNQPAASSSSASSASSTSSAASSLGVAAPAPNRNTTRGLTAVVNNQAIQNPSGVTLPVNAAMQIIGNTNVMLALSPYPPASFQKGNFLVTLTDSEGQAITDAKVSLDLTMPAMRMPTNKPQATHAGDGKYTASAMWTMRGQWRIEVILVRSGVKQSAFFDVWL